MTPREVALTRVRSQELWDVVVIGGGATGLGSAIDAATRGYRTLLLEAHDFAKGTSSRSTKLVHGGVRYLAQGQITLVREALRERGRLLRNAPHLVHKKDFLIPAYRRWERPYYALGLWLYDRLAGRLGLKPSRMVDQQEALRLVPTLEPADLQGGVVYQDGQFDDARLAIALVRTFDDHGGTALNALAVTGFAKNAAGRVVGVLARDNETGEAFQIAARGVINATGVFVDQLRRMDEPGAASLIAPSQGTHIVLERAFLPGETAVLVPKTDDGRVIFAIPWNNHVIVGTTDTAVKETSIEPRPLPEEVDFLLRHAGRYLTRDPKRKDVLSTFAGLRPLISQGKQRSTRSSSISREHAAMVSTSGIVTITGGKWTTYRRMGEDAVDLVARSAGLPSRPSSTADLRLHGWTEMKRDDGLQTYGADAEAVAKVLRERPHWDEPIHQSLQSYRLGEAAWAVREEMARTVEDVLARRMRALFLDAKAAIEIAPKVAAILADELGRNAAWVESQIKSFEDVAKGYSL